jgi:hypothetical protein
LQVFISFYGRQNNRKKGDGTWNIFAVLSNTQGMGKDVTLTEEEAKKLKELL